MLATQLAISTDVLVYRAGKALKGFDAIDNPQARAAAYWKAFYIAQPRDLIQCGPGVFDFGGQRDDRKGEQPNIVHLPELALVRGAGREITTFVNSWGNNTAAGCCFRPGNGSVIEDLGLASTCGAEFQSIVYGWSGTGSPNGARAVARRCNLVGNSWVGYIWGGDKNGLRFEDCDATGGKWLFTCGSTSSALTSCTIDVLRSRVFGDASLSTYQGKVGQRLIAFAARGGVLRVFDSQVELFGNDGVETLATAWTTDEAGHGGPGWPRIELSNVHSRVRGNGAASALDVENNVGVIQVQGGSGSGLGGKYRARGDVVWCGGAAG